MLKDCMCFSREELCDHMQLVSKVAATEDVRDQEGWFDHDKEALLNLIKLHNYLLYQSKMVACDDDCLKEQCICFRSNSKNSITAAKGKWAKHLFEK